MQKFITFGEIMLRLKSPMNERLLQSPFLEATFGGGEANVAVGLARLGIDTAYISVIPDNDIGNACIAELKKHGVDTSMIIRKGKRLGIYFIEAGANQRPSKVIYDREHSSISEVNSFDINWKKVFGNARWFHITGITPAISLSASETSLEAVKKAKDMGVTVSCDLNYRNKLWKYGKNAPDVMDNLVKYADIVVGNEEDCQKSLGIKAEIDMERGKLEVKKYREITNNVLNRYQNIKKIAITIRESHSANYNSWSSVMNNRESFIVSRKYEIKNIVDRVGSGDAFACGLIYGLNKLDNDQKALDFATSASCLMHSIPGDFPLISLEEINNLLKTRGSGRIQR